MPRRSWETGRGPAPRLPRRRVPAAALVLGFGLLTMLFVAAFSGARAVARPPGSPVAVLFDQIALDDPRRDFHEQLSVILEAGDVALREIAPQDATVARFQTLPSDRARFIIVRTHAALLLKDDHWSTDVALFTGEPIDLGLFRISGIEVPSVDRGYGGRSARRGEGRGGADDRAQPTPAPRAYSDHELSTLVPVRRRDGADGRPYYGIGATFVREHMKGRLNDAVVILMGCDSLRGRALSEAFLERGASSVVGWSDEVTAGHTDRATIELVRELVGGASIEDAMALAKQRVGSDPRSGAELVASIR